MSSETAKLNMIRDPRVVDPESQAYRLLQQLREQGVIAAHQWDHLPEQLQKQLECHAHPERLLNRLLDLKLLTTYQVECIRGGRAELLRFGPYRVLDRLGAGSTGVIFRGDDPRTGQAVAIKVLLPEFVANKEVLTRFFAEQKTIAELRHPNIVRALDVGEAASPDPFTQALYYYVMEYVEGTDLERLVEEQGPMAIEDVIAIGAQIADALEEAHRRRLVHRDIKPANILWTQDRQAKLLDFGSVRQFCHRHTQPGSVIGNFQYIAPEQIRDPSSVDIRSDIFALGATLFYCLTGTPPYCSNFDEEELTKRLSEPPPSVTTLRDDIPASLASVIEKMMAVLPDQRFASPTALKLAFASLTGVQVSDACPDATEEQPAADNPPDARPVVVYFGTVEKHREQFVAGAEFAGLAAHACRTERELAHLLQKQPVRLVVADTSTREENMSKSMLLLGTLQKRRGFGLIALGHPDNSDDWRLPGVDDVIFVPFDQQSLGLRLKAALGTQEASVNDTEDLPPESRSNANESEESGQTPPPPEEPAGRSLLSRLFGRNSQSA